MPNTCKVLKNNNKVLKQKIKDLQKLLVRAEVKANVYETMKEENPSEVKRYEEGRRVSDFFFQELKKILTVKK
jgi:hypothetical protein